MTKATPCQRHRKIVLQLSPRLRSILLWVPVADTLPGGSDWLVYWPVLEGGGGAEKFNGRSLRPGKAMVWHFGPPKMVFFNRNLPDAGWGDWWTQSSAIPHNFLQFPQIPQFLTIFWHNFFLSAIFSHEPETEGKMIFFFILWTFHKGTRVVFLLFSWNSTKFAIFFKKTNFGEIDNLLAFKGFSRFLLGAGRCSRRFDPTSWGQPASQPPFFQPAAFFPVSYPPFRINEFYSFPSAWAAGQRQNFGGAKKMAQKWRKWFGGQGKLWVKNRFLFA